MTLKPSLVLLLATLQSTEDGRSVRLLEAARTQIGITLRYDGAYRRIPYPGGDIPLDRGVCTDVVIRAYRSLGIDLQALVHQDMAKAFGKYPNPWRMKAPDSNIDHRRVPNLATFFSRHGRVLEVHKDPTSYAPGDLVTWRLDSGLPHIGLVSDQKNESGIPLIIHNIGAGVKREDVLFSYTITGHYRYFP